MLSQIVVRRVQPSDQARWDEFVFRENRSTFFHQFSWQRIFSEVFSLTPTYLLAERGESIVGILPLAHQKSLLFGNALISTPFCVEGGTLAIDDTAKDELDRAAIALAQQLGAKSLEFRS